MNWYYSAKTDPNGACSIVLCDACANSNAKRRARIEVSLPNHNGNQYPGTDCEECGKKQVIEPHTLIGCGCPACRIKRMRDPFGMF